MTAMGKRSTFPRFPQDAYDTPFEAAAPLLPHLTPGTRFVEPCVGRGHLLGHLKRAEHVLVGAYDLPDDARAKRYTEAQPGVVFITNPPWSRDVLHPIIVNLSDQLPAWLLIDFDWLATQQSAPFLPRLCVIVVIGRVRWIPDSPYDGKDNATWCLFDRPRADGCAIRFFGRADSARPERRSHGRR
jgi:hypothetical protein